MYIYSRLEAWFIYLIRLCNLIEIYINTCCIRSLTVGANRQYIAINTIVLKKCCNLLHKFDCFMRQRNILLEFPCRTTLRKTETSAPNFRLWPDKLSRTVCARARK
jgi:hypothetical protein